MGRGRGRPADRCGTMGSVADTDRVTPAIAELYSGELEAFTERRRDLAAQARTAGDRAAAKAIAGLGKPTRSAWVINRLVHADPSVTASLTELGDRLRAGEAALDGASIRELSRARRELIDSLVRRALAESGQRAPSAALRDEVTDTFSAALADPQVAEQVAAGTLLRAARWAGFGPGIGTAPAAAPPRAAASGVRSRQARAGQPAGEAGAPPDEAEARAERERERRQVVAAAEQAVAEADAANEAAAAAEREIDESVKSLAERLQREQQRLVRARRDARQARAALSRARHALDRLARSGRATP